MRFLVASALAAVLTAVLGAQHELYLIRGSSGYSPHGYSVAALGHVDKDGHGDFVVGNPGANTNGGASGSVRVVSGRTGATLRTIDGEKALDQFGYAVAGAGDVDRDGHPDILAGTYRGTTNLVRVFSGKDGRLLYSYTDPVHGASWFGYALAGVGDANLDGYDDFVVGAAKEVNSGFGPVGSAYLYSGKDGKLLHKLLSTFSGYGGYVAGVGDVDRDGFADVLVASFDNAVDVRSGRDGKVLHTFRSGERDPYGFGVALSGAGDVDRDGFADVILGDHQYYSRPQGPGYAIIYSGKTGNVLHTLRGDQVGDGFGLSVGRVGDLDGDQHADVIVGAPSSLQGTGYIRVFSGRTGKVLAEHRGSAARPRLGAQVAGLGDVNKDGKPDFIATCSQTELAQVFSGAALSLTAEPSELSLAAGGVQTMRLFAGAGQGGKLYWIVGSLSGTSPGTPLRPGFTLPLNFDAYTELLIANPNTLLANSRAWLSITGTASAALHLPAGVPEAVGRELFHAYAVIDVDAGRFDFVSNPVALTLTR